MGKGNLSVELIICHLLKTHVEPARNTFEREGERSLCL